MVLIFGGAFQGKTEFAKSKFNLNEEDVFDCSKEIPLDFNKKILIHIEKLILRKIQNKESAFDFFEENLSAFEDKIIICEDVCCGVVPMDRELRLYRDNVGKQMQIFSRNASEIYRVFCGIGEKIK